MKPIELACVLGITLALAPATMAQNLSYSGKVVDEAGASLPWALLSLDGGPAVAQSDANGNFTLAGIAAAGLYPEVYPHRIPPLSREPDAAPPAFLSDGRSLPVTHGTAGARLPRSRVFYIGPVSRPAGATEATVNSGDAFARTGQSAATSVLGVSKVNFQAGSFPQTQSTAKDLVLTLLKSATDTATYAAEKKICLDTINACRATLGLKPVVWSKSLEAFADEGARYDAGVNAAHKHFGKFSAQAVPADAENALPGWPLKFYTVAAAVKEGTKQMWAEGPGGGHYENIKGNQTSVGCGVFITAAGNIWVVQDFK